MASEWNASLGAATANSGLGRKRNTKSAKAMRKKKNIRLTKYVMLGHRPKPTTYTNPIQNIPHWCFAKAYVKWDWMHLVLVSACVHLKHRLFHKVSLIWWRLSELVWRLKAEEDVLQRRGVWRCPVKFDKKESHVHLFPCKTCGWWPLAIRWGRPTRFSVYTFYRVHLGWPAVWRGHARQLRRPQAKTNWCTNVDDLHPDMLAPNAFPTPILSSSKWQGLVVLCDVTQPRTLCLCKL